MIKLTKKVFGNNGVFSESWIGNNHWAICKSLVDKPETFKSLDTAEVWHDRAIWREKPDSIYHESVISRNIESLKEYTKTGWGRMGFNKNSVVFQASNGELLYIDELYAKTFLDDIDTVYAEGPKSPCFNSQYPEEVDIIVMPMHMNDNGYNLSKKEVLK